MTQRQSLLVENHENRLLWLDDAYWEALDGDDDDDDDGDVNVVSDAMKVSTTASSLRYTVGLDTILLY